MESNLKDLIMEKNLTLENISFSSIEDELKKKFNLNSEQFNKALIESENVEKFLEALNLDKEDTNNG